MLPLLFGLLIFFVSNQIFPLFFFFIHLKTKIGEQKRAEDSTISSTGGLQTPDTNKTEEDKHQLNGHSGIFPSRLLWET